MRFIAIAGYFDSGSSALTDLFEEFEDIRVPKAGLEWRFLQDPDGVRALEYNIVENNHRHNTSHAIKRFKKMCELTQKKWYRLSVEDDFINATIEYIDTITELKSETYWHYDNFEKGMFFKIISKLFFLFISSKNKLFGTNTNDNLLRFTHEMGYYSAISSEEFYLYTQQYIEEVFKRYDNKKYIVADQLIPPSNIRSYFPYFKEKPKAIVVDRDPRDIFIECREKSYGVVPYEVEEWCKWFEITRRHRKFEEFGNEILFIQFEDLIYNYDKTVSVITDYLEINKSEHIYPRKSFIPEISINNTNKAKHHSELKKEIQYIEKRLREYLYNF